MCPLGLEVLKQGGEPPNVGEMDSEAHREEAWVGLSRVLQAAEPWKDPPLGCTRELWGAGRGGVPVSPRAGWWSVHGQSTPGPFPIPRLGGHCRWLGGQRSQSTGWRGAGAPESGEQRQQ